MVVYNYTKIKRREKRLYSIFNTNISSSGIIINTLQTCGILLAIFSILGLIFCALTKKLWYNPLLFLGADSNKTSYFYIFFIALPVVLGFFLHSYKIQNYKLIDYIKIYFTPKISLDQNGKRIKLDKYKIDTFVERV